MMMTTIRMLIWKEMNDDDNDNDDDNSVYCFIFNGSCII